MRTLTALLTAFLLVFTSCLYSQNDFKLGFTGAYPNYYNYTEFAKINWNYYNEFKMNTWSGWWVGDTNTHLMDILKNRQIEGYFQPDTLRWAAYGRMQINEAEEDQNIRFRYTGHRCGTNYKDETQFGYGQWVRYFNKNSLCNEEQSPAGLVLWGVYENGFQSYSGLPLDPKYQVSFPGNDGNGGEINYVNTYYIKPRMRIDSAEAFSDPPKNVCKVIVKAHNGDIINQTVITTNRFRDASGSVYTGQYLEEFYLLPISVSGDSLNRGRGPNDPLGELQTCQVDYQIYWYGTVSVYIDYVKVMDEAANRLFNNDPLYGGLLKNRLSDKITRLKNYETAINDTIIEGFYMEEIDYSNLACLKYLNETLLPQWSGNEPRYKMIGLINPGSYQAHLHSNWHQPAYGEYIDSVKPPYLMTVRYSFTGSYNLNPDWRNVLPNTISSITMPAHYPQGVKDDINELYGINGTNWVSTANYNNYLQNTTNSGTLDLYSGDMKYFNDLCKQKIIEWISVPQIIFWHMKGSTFWMREPLNSELGATFGIALCNGAKGILPYAYESGFWTSTIIMGGSSQFYIDNNQSFNYNISFGASDFSSGITWGDSKRELNFYNENKWSYMKDLYEKMDKWGPILTNSIYTAGFSVSRDGANHRFINNILSIDPHRNDLNNCPNDGPTGQYYDCEDQRFWELGFFDDIGTTKYFMAVNRRCVPAGGGYAGDDRVLRIKFNLTGPVNWQISEVGSSVRPKVFDRTKYASFGENPGEMGWFNPGEGKLFKIEPAINSGGELVEDEFISGGEFTCQAAVYNNGHNITIGANTTIHFNDSSRFVMNGGVFTVGDQNTSAPQNITNGAVSGSSWSGHRFTNCVVKIFGATFTGLANDTTYAVNIIDCPVVDIRNSTFNTNSSLKGGVNAVFYSDPNNEISLSNIYIGANTFNSSGSTIPTVNVSSYAGETTPLIIENNTFNEGNTAVFLSGITGGAIKGNSITDNFIGINALTSQVDIKSNIISSTVNNAIGIFAAGGSELKMNNAGSKTLGGLNELSNSGTAANNIVVDGSVFLLDGGQNIFNITDDQTSKHLYGYFPMFTAVSYDEKNNCFNLNSSPVDPPYNMVTSGFQGSQITFNFTPYLSGCDANDGGDGFAINLGDGIFDTIYNQGSGSGGSQNSVTSVRRTDSKIPLLGGVDGAAGRGGFLLTSALIPPRRDFETASHFLGRGALVSYTPKQKYDSISILMRYRNYSQSRTKCLDLINTYPDSIQSLNAVSKLFLSTVASDTSYNAVNELKTYYENLILNNSGNVSLVKRANYYILKCRVRMREYSQALAGFQQIINQNPYSYEGLIARWDYMATSLLIQGQGGGERGNSDFGSGISDLESEELFQYNDNNPQSESHNPKSTGDKQPFTKEQKLDIRKSINTAIEISKNEDDRKIKSLEDRSEKGDVNASKELSQLLTLKQVIKTDRPKSITEHVRIVSEDIRKVFGSNTGSKGNEPKNIPLVFRLSQNYPNPFNPVTKINYDLPKDSKVKIVIYDILGREIKRLVNSELKTAGSYIVDFNASNYASGVYFYHIEAEESNGNKFVDSKKMVLIK
ncbi:MAG TPA: T9SS type A sorting domain-containing protein [Ignavibacteria bacterium]|nr:T9SS type A sorting domain-containing protein [Ignavibacteria bacterium]